MPNPIQNVSPSGSQLTLSNMFRAGNKMLTLGTGNPWLGMGVGTLGLGGLGYLLAPNLIRRMNPQNQEPTDKLRRRGMGAALGLGTLGTLGVLGIHNWDKIRQLFKKAYCEKTAEYAWTNTPGTSHIGLRGMMTDPDLETIDPNVRVNLYNAAVTANPSGGRQSGLINPWDIANVLVTRGATPALSGLISAGLNLSQSNTQGLTKALETLLPLMTTGVISTEAPRGLGSALGANMLSLMRGL